MQNLAIEMLEMTQGLNNVREDVESENETICTLENRSVHAVH